MIRLIAILLGASLSGCASTSVSAPSPGKMPLGCRIAKVRFGLAASTPFGEQHVSDDQYQSVRERLGTYLVQANLLSDPIAASGTSEPNRLEILWTEKASLSWGFIPGISMLALIAPIPIGRVHKTAEFALLSPSREQLAEFTASSDLALYVSPLALLLPQGGTVRSVDTMTDRAMIYAFGHALEQDQILQACQ
jgi:hypothetical protein